MFEVTLSQNHSALEKPTHCMPFYRFFKIKMSFMLQFESLEIQACDTKDLLLYHSYCNANDQCNEPIKDGLKC